MKVDGFDITIENPKGSERRGVDADGKEWSQEMHNTYGYIRGTEGVDGDHIDMFLSDHLDDWNGKVFVVDQVNKDGSFDEHKVMYGFNSEQEARDAYLSNYEEGWTGLGTITGVDREEFRKWIDSSHRKTKPFAEYSGVRVSNAQYVDNTDKKTTSSEGDDAVSGNPSTGGLPQGGSAHLSRQSLTSQSPLDAAKVLQNTLITARAARKIQNEGGLKGDLSTESNAVRILGKELHLRRSKSSQSYYNEFYEGQFNVNGRTVEVRVSTHPANGATMGNAPTDDKISIVIRKNGEHVSTGPHNGYIEYVFEPTEVSPKDAANAIVQGVESIIRTGDFTDVTGKAHKYEYPYIDKSGNKQYSLSEEERDEQIHSENFKRWFGDWENDPENASKVVDAEGRPLVVYHQTNAKRWINRETGEDWEKLDWKKKQEWDDKTDEEWQNAWEEKDFYEFDDRYARQSIEMPAIFFSPNNDPYHEYGQRTIAAYLDIKNPAINPDIPNRGVTDTAGRDAMEALKAQGYDGFIRTDEDGNVLEYGVFSSEQIKSAEAATYDDNGNLIPLSERFDTGKKDIRYSLSEGLENYTPRGSQLEQNLLNALFRLAQENKESVDRR